MAYYLAWDANERNSDQIEAVGDGLVAHLLDKQHLRAYQAEVGGERVQAELAQAITRELRLSDEAETLAKSLGLLGKTTPAAPPQLPSATPAGYRPWDVDVIPTAPTAVDVLQDCLNYPTILIYGPSGRQKHLG